MGDPVGRINFTDSVFYKGFLEQRFVQELSRAKAATGAERIALLTDLVDSQPPAAILTEATTALEVSDNTLPMAVKVAWLLKEPEAAAVARAWSGDASELCDFVKFGCASPRIEGMAYDSFVKVAMGMIRYEIKPGNPLLAEVLTYIQEIQQMFSGQIPPWLHNLQ